MVKNLKTITIKPNELLISSFKSNECQINKIKFDTFNEKSNFSPNLFSETI